MHDGSACWEAATGICRLNPREAVRSAAASFCRHSIASTRASETACRRATRALPRELSRYCSTSVSTSSARAAATAHVMPKLSLRESAASDAAVWL